jgi:hypothetical protein
MDKEGIDRSIREFMNRRIYRELTPDVLAAIADDDLEQAIVDFVGTKIGDNYQREYEIVTAQRPGIQAIYTTFYLEAEVANGGFQQYFWNSSGQFAIEAFEGCRVIGAHVHASVLAAAIERFLEEEPTFRKFREINTLEAFAESYKYSTLDDLDRQFFEASELGPIRLAYIRQYPDNFTAA